jgi:hypothetical protein
MVTAIGDWSRPGGSAEEVLALVRYRLITTQIRWRGAGDDDLDQT